MSFENGAPTFAQTLAASSVEPVVEQPAVDVNVEAAAPMLETPETPDAPAPPVEQVTPSVESLSFEQYARTQGWDLPEDIDQEEFYNQALERITAGTRALTELEKVQRELESLRSAAAPNPLPAPPPTQPQPEAPITQAEAVAERIFRDLKPYDPQLNLYVNRDERTGVVTPKPEYGRDAIEAAKTINDFHRQEREQAERLLQNPGLLFKDHQSEIERLVEAKATAIIEARMSALEKADQERRLQYEAAEQERAARVQADQWHAENKSKIYKTSSDGKELVNPFNPEEKVMTPLGNAFVNEFNKLYDSYGQSLKLIDLQRLAMMAAEASVPHTPAAPVASPAPSKTPAQQRQEFIQQRSAVVPNQEVTPATVDELEHHRPGRLNFADWARKMPENQNLMSSW